ncbi:hypothetical protein [Streptomyces sp. WAC 06738]|uniref:hypothetical protein n=1 Tax=Streptomyces sp. WAC 06738 TaxID=2203210 RepID=UPI000F775BE9|nr:hypothetical protein [Streptomyces sp. WAC 06738]
MRNAGKAIGAAAAALLTLSLAGAGTANAEDGSQGFNADNWTCEPGSKPSATDPGGRDAWITVRHKDDSTNFARFYFQAHGEIFTFTNSTDVINSSGDTLQFDAYAIEFNNDWDWRWWLFKRTWIEDNVSLPEDQGFSMELWSDQGSTGPCMNRSGRT